MGKKYTFRYVYSYFEEQGCELLEKEYINAHTVMEYKCSCGNKSKICFHHFNRGGRCNKCGKNKKHTFEYVYNYFEEQGCKLLENEYINTNEKMHYRCSCGGYSKISFKRFKKGERCRECGRNRKFTYKEVYDYFEKEKCRLLDNQYINNNTVMRYECECGDISTTSFKSFRKGVRCRECRVKNMSGEKHWNYNPDLTDREREKNKTRLADYIYKKWRTEVYKKDKYICQKCSQKNKYLNAHHIESWSSNRDLRLIQSNGITLCQDCHIKFHQKYGYNNNNRQQLNKFL